MRFKVKLEYDPEASLQFQATLYEVKKTGGLRYVAGAFSDSRSDALDRIRRKRDAFVSRQQPEWFDLEAEEPTPQSLKAMGPGEAMSRHIRATDARLRQKLESV